MCYNFFHDTGIVCLKNRYFNLSSPFLSSHYCYRASLKLLSNSLCLTLLLTLFTFNSSHVSAKTATISINNLQAQTTYGPPNSNNYGSATKTYTFTLAVNDETDRKITHIQPQSMNVWTINTVYPQGYNPAVWDGGKGFSVSKMKATGKQFPSTGFDKAVFDVIGTGSDQSKYRCSTTGDWIRLSGSASGDLGQNCRVTYHHDSKQSKPQTPVKIDMYYRNDNNSWSKVDSYTIPVPQKWAISPVGESYQARYGNRINLSTSKSFDALDACRKVGPRADNKATNRAEGAGKTDQNRAFRQQFMYRRDELINSEHADRTKYPEGVANTSGYSYYSRDIGTFMGEWGFLQNYAKSPWSGNYWYWTAEAYSKYSQLYVNKHGDVSWETPALRYGVVVCRGE